MASSIASARSVAPALSARRPGSLAQDVQAELLSRIRAGRYPAGQKLPTEAELVESFGVSRTVVREAVSRLQASGLVHTRHGIGTFVVDTPSAEPFQVHAQDLATLQDVIAVLELRIAVETEAAALAAQRRSAADLQRLRRALSGFTRAARQGLDAVEHDLAFHQAIAHATRNERFTALLAALGEGAIPRARLRGSAAGEARGPEYLAQINAEHAAIVGAIAASDPEAARQAMRRHLTNGKNRRAAALKPVHNKETR